MIARHRLAADGAGVMVRDHGHIIAFEHAALTAFTNAAPHRRKQPIPPGPAALAAAEQLRQHGHHRTRYNPTATTTPTDQHADTPDTAVVIDLACYATAAEGRNTLT